MEELTHAQPHTHTLTHTHTHTHTPHLVFLTCVCVFLSPQEKGTTPLHVAAKAGQVLQAELLVVYGADPGAPDINGRTPMDYARYHIHACAHTHTLVLCRHMFLLFLGNVMHNTVHTH